MVLPRAAMARKDRSQQTFITLISMNEYVAPKPVARAIQVSESSVKRWRDKGVTPTQKTAPEVLGLSATTGQTSRVIDWAAENLTAAVDRGDDEQCRQITLDHYLPEAIARSACRPSP